MKCSNCGYFSFDYNQSCPKCDKDTSVERAKLNLPDYRSDPPFLLGALTGPINESDVEIDYSADIEVVDRQGDMSLMSSIETEIDETSLEKAEKITVVIDKKKGRIWAGA
jgi:hypothetical protein